MVMYSAVFILFSVISTIPLQARHMSRSARLREHQFRRFRLPSVDKRVTSPSGSFLDKLGRVKSFQDLYREFRVPKSQQIPVKKKPTKPGVLPLNKLPSISGQGLRPQPLRPGTTNVVVSVPEVDTSHGATYCQKRKKCVEIPQPRDQSGIHWPYCVSVPRCSGCCSTVSAFQKCVAVRASPRQVDVYYVPYDTTVIPRPSKVNIIVHDQCQCRCRQSASSCNANQVFVARHCRCECNPRVSTTCSTKFKWDPTSCKCVCKHPPFQCPRNRYYSKLTCGCVCRPRSCARGYVFDMGACDCVLSRAIQTLPFKPQFKWPLSLGRKDNQRSFQFPGRQQLD